LAPCSGILNAVAFPEAAMLKSAVLVAVLVSAASASAQTLPLKRDLDIGTAEGEPAYEFSRVGSIAVGNDGTIFVANGATSSIRLFTPQGKFIRELGRRGNGPGEFQGVRLLQVMGDTLLLFDAGLQRTTLLDLSGKVLATWRNGFDSQTRAEVVTTASLSGGWLIYRYQTNRNVVGQASSSPIEFTFTTEPQKGWQAASRPIASVPFIRSIGIATPGGVSSGIPLFEPEGRFAADNRGLLYLADGYDYRIDVYDATGKRIRTMTRPHQPVPITDKLIAAYRKEVSMYFDTAKAKAGEWQIDKAAREAKGRLPTRAHLPAIGVMYVSQRGPVLVERPDLRPDPLLPELPAGLNKPQPAIYDLFDPSGRFLGSVRFGANFRARAVTENAILGVERDELDVEHVVRYTLR
jgi:hypothetical protein